MTKILNHINTYADLTAYNADKDKNYPNIAYIIESNEVKWVKEKPDLVVCKYNVTSTSEATKLLGSTTGITYQIIDDVISDTVKDTYTFDTLGEHTVKYKFDGTSIGGSVFYSCTSLTSVNIGNSVKTIGNDAFNNCTGLTSVTIADSVLSIGFQVFDNTPWYNNQPDGLVYAGKVAYKYKGTMPENTSITFEDGTLGIAYSAFYSCTGLTSVTIPDSVILIGERAFYQCSGLTSVTIPNSVTEIRKNAFYSCTGLTSVTIPDSVILIGERAFRYCTGLASVSVGNSVTSIGNQVFYNTPWYNNQPDGLVYAGKVAYKYKGTMPSGTSIILKEETKGIADNAFENCGGLTSITIPNSVTSIGGQSFYSCSGLTSVTIPNSVTEIGRQAFRNCSGLTSVNIPNSVTSIGRGAFRNCSGLTSLTIPNSVISIDSQSFIDCTGLTSVTIQATTPPTLGHKDAFDNTNNCPIYVPADSLSAYVQEGDWGLLVDRIQPIVA